MMEEVEMVKEVVSYSQEEEAADNSQDLGENSPTRIVKCKE